MPTVSSVLTQRRFFGCSSADRVKNGVFRFYYRNISYRNIRAPLRSAKAQVPSLHTSNANLDDLYGARGAPARVANAFAAPDAGCTDVVWAMVPTACGKWRHVVNTKIIRVAAK